MRRASAIQKESQQIGTVGDLTGVFESIASTQVAKIKSKVELSKEFFELLWKRYSSLRIDPRTRITHRDDKDINPKKVFVIISAEAGLSGDIDQRLIETMLKDYDNTTTDIVVLGTHGANQLKQGGIPYIHYFQVPASEGYIDVNPVIDVIIDYSKITLYYEEYISLGVQGIKKLDLHARIREMSEDADEDETIITADDTIFEPSLEEIADIMEAAMMNLAFSQAILESGLAQDASRFNAMATSKKRAWELMNFYNLDYHRAKRSENDRRSREVMVGLKRKKRQRLAENG
jgi:F-type H+-transporting ATPase subunit gamma